MNKNERRVRNAVASAEAEGVVFSQSDIDDGYRIVRGELDVEEYIRRLYSSACDEGC